MYHFVVARIVRRSFRHLSQGDYRSATGLMSEKCHYHFVGYHALGGHRHSRALITKWFERFLRILPGFQFVPVNVVVKGWPWKTIVVVRLQVSWKRPDGRLYENVALQMVTLKWFNAVDILTIDDSQAFGVLLTELAQSFGVSEAAAAPIEG
ncbi:MAG: nuclear transport factor 2 family protein [Desulfomonilia bacterium]